MVFQAQHGLPSPSFKFSVTAAWINKCTQWLDHPSSPHCLPGGDLASLTPMQRRKPEHGSNNTSMVLPSRDHHLSENKAWREVSSVASRGTVGGSVLSRGSLDAFYSLSVTPLALLRQEQFIFADSPPWWSRQGSRRMRQLMCLH